MVALKGTGRRTVARQGHAEPLGDFQDEGHLSPALQKPLPRQASLRWERKAQDWPRKSQMVFPGPESKLATDNLWGIAEITGCCWFGSCAFTPNRLPFLFSKSDYSIPSPF